MVTQAGNVAHTYAVGLGNMEFTFNIVSIDSWTVTLELLSDAAPSSCGVDVNHGYMLRDVLALINNPVNKDMLFVLLSLVVACLPSFKVCHVRPHVTHSVLGY